ncbi:MAG TPA: SDR family oxidoreductase [Anaerolineales bacterium]|nr:SDR family oxidoreductase [Anaerolineales bacterium]
MRNSQLKKRIGKEKRPEVVVITGASAGIGRATAQRFARDGAKVGLLARGLEGLEGARRDVEMLGGEALAIPTDVSSAEQVETAASKIEERLGPIDIWINNAMVSVFSPVKEMQAEEYRRVTEVAYLGYVYGTLSAVKRMLPRDRGTVVQVGSALAFRGIPLQSSYCGAKHAIQGFTESLRTELLHDHSNVWVTMVHLPASNTPQFNWVKSRLPRKPQPYPPVFQPEVPAEAIYYAAHHRRREMFVGWPTLKTVIGNRLVPGYVDRVLANTAYEGQQYNGLVELDRQDNLWQPVPRDLGAHGDFDEGAKSSSWLLWADIHQKPITLGISAITIAGLLIFKAISKGKF